MTSFSIVKNRRDNSSGHIFQGRFKSIIVDNRTYGKEVTRYIHLNPARTKHLLRQSISERRHVVRTYRWSSYTAILGVRKCPLWLKRDLILRRFGSVRKEQLKNYRCFVEDGLSRDVSDPFEEVIAQSILGSEQFIDKLRRRAVAITDNLNLRREKPSAQKLSQAVSLETLLDAVSHYYGVDRSSLLQKNSRGTPRQVLLALASNMCRGRQTLTELSTRLGPVSVGCLTVARYTINKRIGKDRKLKNDVLSIRKAIGINS